MVRVGVWEKGKWMLGGNPGMSSTLRCWGLGKLEKLIVRGLYFLRSSGQGARSLRAQPGGQTRVDK